MSFRDGLQGWIWAFIRNNLCSLTYVFQITVYLFVVWLEVHANSTIIYFDYGIINIFITLLFWSLIIMRAFFFVFFLLQKILSNYLISFFSSPLVPILPFGSQSYANGVPDRTCSSFPSPVAFFLRVNKFC